MDNPVFLRGMNVENVDFSDEEVDDKERILADRMSERLRDIHQSLMQKDKQKKNHTLGRPSEMGKVFGKAVQTARKEKRDVGIGNDKMIAQVARSVTRENCKSEFKNIWPAFGDDPKTSPKLSMIEHLKFGRDFFAFALNGYYQGNVKTKKSPPFFPSELMDLCTRIFIGTFGSNEENGGHGYNMVI
jgi:hypothetical protein